MALDFVAGCVGGVAGVIVGHPFDTLKVKIQTQDFRNPVYRGAWHCLVTVLKTESVKGLYKGVTSPMAGVAAVNAVVFGSYGSAQRNLEDPDSLRTHFIAGSFAGFCQSLVCSPMELVKTRLQVQKRSIYTGSFDCFTKIFRTGGVRGIMSGLGPTMLRDVPAFGIYFYTYERISRTAPGGLSTGGMLLAGGMAGTMSWIVTYPVDVIKSRLQSDGLDGPRKYTGALDCLRKSVALEGFQIFFRGLTSTLLRAFPTNAVTFTVVGWFFRIVGQPSDQPELLTIVGTPEYGSYPIHDDHHHAPALKLFIQHLRATVHHLYDDELRSNIDFM